MCSPATNSGQNRPSPSREFGQGTMMIHACGQSLTFCACCGVDITRFSHEFWCRYSIH